MSVVGCCSPIYSALIALCNAKNDARMYSDRVRHLNSIKCTCIDDMCTFGTPDHCYSLEQDLNDELGFLFDSIKDIYYFRHQMEKILFPMTQPLKRPTTILLTI